MCAGIFVRKQWRMMMSKQMRTVNAGDKNYKGSAKKSGHGSYKAKRKPTSPMVLRKAREKAASEFGKSPEFRKAIYGIVESEE